MNTREIPKISGVPNIKWNELRDGVVESSPALETSGYLMNLMYLGPNQKHKLEGKEFVLTLLRGSITGKQDLPLQKSILTKGGFELKSGEKGCLLFVAMDEGDNHKYFDDISGLEIKWVQTPAKMYRSEPEIHVGKYMCNLNYIPPTQSSSIHDHAAPPGPAPLIEFHTQLRGNGWMVAYEDREGKIESKRVRMERGFTHDVFCFVKDADVLYPWHAYIADKAGAFFIVFKDIRGNI